MGKYATIYDIQLATKQHGHHFFDKSSKRFFDSRIGREVINGRYFITSEQFHGSTSSGPRLYTVRRAEDNGVINTVGEYQQFTSNAQARRYAEKLLDTASLCANCRKETYNRNFTCDACARKA